MRLILHPEKQMKRRNKNKLLAVVSLSILSISICAQKQISITIDDPNTKETPKLNCLERDSIILNTLDLHRIKAALFVCGMRVNSSYGKALLDHWDSRNHLICNHSYSHLYYNSTSVTSENYIADFKKCDSLISGYNNFVKLFRFPFLKEGNSVEKIDSMRTALKKEGYKNGYVTIDASDWYVDSQLTSALEKDINSDLTPYKEYYIKHILERANYYDSLAQLVFKRDIKHTLLIHHSLLNALFLNDLLNELKANGWELIDAEHAFKDEVFQLQPGIIPCGESIIWQFAKQLDWVSKELRFPAEDGEYEKVPLERYVEQYIKRMNKK